MKKIITILLTLLALATIGLTACNTAKTATLENTTWVLESYGKQAQLSPVLEGIKVTAVFDNNKGEVTGSAGCNNYFASYEINGSQISVSDVGATRMFCGEPAGLMEQEDQYLMLLQGAETFQIKNNKLWIFSIDDQVLIFGAE